MKFLHKAASFLRAVASLRHGLTTPETYHTRSEACLEPCEALRKESAAVAYYCSECGCPSQPQADLRVKWLMRGATCPRSKWPM